MEIEEEALQLDVIYRSLSEVATLDEGSVLQVADYVLQSLQCKSFTPQAWFHLFLYILEREPQALGRRNVVQIISEVVLCVRRRRSPCPFVELVRKEITVISHASDTGNGEVRIFLHQCIFSWIQAGIVTTQFLKCLQQAEEKWTFSHVRPQYTKTASEESPSTFDLVLLGIQGPGLSRKLDMSKVVELGMAQGVREGWMYIDGNGRYVVRVLENPQEIHRTGTECKRRVEQKHL